MTNFIFFSSEMDWCWKVQSLYDYSLLEVQNFPCYFATISKIIAII